MTKDGENFLQELIKTTKANRAATFALLGHLRDTKNGRRRIPADLPKLSELSSCPGCGQAFRELERELHHMHYEHPEILEAQHCPCKLCCPQEDCGCSYCIWPRDERLGIKDSEVGTTSGKLL